MTMTNDNDRPSTKWLSFRPGWSNFVETGFYSFLITNGEKSRSANAPDFNQLEWGALVKDAGSFKLSSSISEAQRDTLTRIQFKTAAYLRRLAQPFRCFV